MFFVLDIYAMYFVYGNVPETKGLTLEQITMMLEKFADVPMRQPIKVDNEEETRGFLPRRDSEAMFAALDEMQNEDEDNADYGTQTNATP